MKKMEKSIKRYVAYNPLSLVAEEWWTSNTLQEMSDIFDSWGDSKQPIKINKVYDGCYGCGNFVIYDTTKNPEIIDEVKNR